jgi:hypothetical protein
MPNERDRAPAEAHPTGRPMPPDDDGSEPDWAEEIRARRRARGDRLREIFATFDEDHGRPGSDPPEPRP